jgi:MFS family permease
MICQQCGAELPEEDNFCIFCGTPTGRTDIPAVRPVFAPKLNISKLLGDTYYLYTKHFGTLCLAALVLCGVPMFFSVCGDAAAGFIKTAENRGLIPALYAIVILCYILNVVAQCYFSLGVLRPCLYLARGGSGAKASLMFPPFMMTLKMMGLYVLLFIIYFVLFMMALFPLIGGIIAGRHPDGGFAVVLCVLALSFPMFCLFCWIVTRLYLSQSFLADQNTGVIDSMRYSWRVTSGNVLRLLVGVIVLAFFAMLGMIPYIIGVVFLAISGGGMMSYPIWLMVVLLLGMILTVNISWLGMVLAYLQLTGQPNCLDAFRRNE